jgi:hypothetical protein
MNPLLTALLLGVFCGTSVTAGLAYSWREHVRVTLNETLRKDNEHLRDEVARLRAQVALHIGVEK